MPKRSSSDLNQLAATIVAHSTNGDNGHHATNGNDGEMPKNPAAVALGRLGGLKGGKARADSLTKARRQEIAKKAAASRWKKNGS